MTIFGIIATLVVTSVTIGALGYAVFRAVSFEIRRRHLEVGTAIFLQLGVIYAVFLAFVFGQALTSFVAADDAIDAECARLHAVSMLATALPASERASFQRAIDDYIDDVLHKEWSAMRSTRKGSEAASASEIKMLEMANGWAFKDPSASADQSRIMEQLLEAHNQRERRLFEAGQGIPTGLWVMILIYAAGLVGLLLFSSLENIWSHTVLCGIFGGLNALVLLAVFLLQYPFEGPFRLAPTTFAATHALVHAPGP